MSGHKRATIFIREDEYRRLHEAEMKLRFIPKAAKENNYIDEQLHCAIQDQFQQAQNRQDEFNLLLEGLDQEISLIGANTAEAITANQMLFSEKISETVGNLVERTNVLLATQMDHFEKILATERQQRVSGIQSIQQSITAFESSHARKIEIAREWMQRGDELIQYVHENYDHNFFSPGKVERFDQALRQARNYLEEGMPEAALIVSQEVYSDLCDLRIELERLLLEWNTLFQATWEEVSRLIDDFNRFRTCSAHDLDGNALPIEIEVDYWSNGEFSLAESKVSEIQQRIYAPRVASIHLLDILQNELPLARQRLEDAIFHARLTVLNSQLRINIADLVIKSLQTQGYFLQQAEYAKDDQRMGYSAKVQNYEGNQIVIQVYPSDSIGKNDLHLLSLDREQRTEHELRQRSLEVTQSLSQHGLKVDQLRVIGKDTAKGNRNHNHEARVISTTSMVKTGLLHDD